MEYTVAGLHKHIVERGQLPDHLQFYRHRMGKGTLQDVVMATNRNSDTALHVAARHGHLGVVRQLCTEYGVGLDQPNADGKTGLHEAAQSGHVDCVHYLIEAGCHVDSLKRADWTPLMLACSKGNLQMVTALVNHGALLTLVNKDGWTPFHIAAREGAIDVLAYLLKTDSTCAKTISYNGRTPLHSAALHGRSEAINFLCNQCSADVNTKDSCGATPLMDAVRGNHLAATRLLMKAGAELQIEDVLGRHCIHCAAQAGSLEVTEYIVSELGSDVNRLAGRNGSTPLHYAAKEGQSAMISLLLRCGADPHIRDAHGRTALDVAQNARNGLEAVRILSTYQ